MKYLSVLNIFSIEIFIKKKRSIMFNVHIFYSNLNHTMYSYIILSVFVENFLNIYLFGRFNKLVHPSLNSLVSLLNM